MPLTAAMCGSLAARGSPASRVLEPISFVLGNKQALQPQRLNRVQRDEVAGEACANGTGCTPRTPIASPTYAPKKTSLPANALIMTDVSRSGLALYTRSVSIHVTLTTTSGANMPSQTSLPNRIAKRQRRDARSRRSPTRSFSTISPRFPLPNTVLARS